MRSLGISQLYDCDVICFGDVSCLWQSASEAWKYLTITLRNRAEYLAIIRGRYFEIASFTEYLLCTDNEYPV